MRERSLTGAYALRSAVRPQLSVTRPCAPGAGRGRTGRETRGRARWERLPSPSAYLLAFGSPPVPAPRWWTNPAAAPARRLLDDAIRVAGLVEGGAPGGEQLQRVVGRGARLGGVGGDPKALVGGEVECLIGEGDVADGRVAEPLDAGAVEPHVVRGPPGAEVVAAGGQLTDQVGQGLVVRAAPGLGAQHRHHVLGLALPVWVELRGGGVEEQEAGVVGGLGGAGQDRREQGRAEPV